MVGSRCPRQARNILHISLAASINPVFSGILGQDQLQREIRKTLAVPLCSEMVTSYWMFTSRKELRTVKEKVLREYYSTSQLVHAQRAKKPKLVDFLVSR